MQITARPSLSPDLPGGTSVRIAVQRWVLDRWDGWDGGWVSAFQSHLRNAWFPAPAFRTLAEAGAPTWAAETFSRLVAANGGTLNASSMCWPGVSRTTSGSMRSKSGGTASATASASLWRQHFASTTRTPSQSSRSPRSPDRAGTSRPRAVRSGRCRVRWRRCGCAGGWRSPQPVRLAAPPARRPGMRRPGGPGGRRRWRVTAATARRCASRVSAGGRPARRPREGAARQDPGPGRGRDWSWPPVRGGQVRGQRDRWWWWWWLSRLPARSGPGPAQRAAVGGPWLR
jgi:hypothetical protein